MLLTHRDDIADHELFRRKFGCERIMHADDGAARLGVERIIKGEGAIHLDDDWQVIPTPGHTRGHVVFLYQNKFLFTGDHLAWSPARDTLIAFRDACWYSWPVQTRSMERLLDYRFEWVLPGHGWRGRYAAQEMPREMARSVEWMKRQR